MKPKEVSELDIAFPGSVSHLMPKYADIPDAFKNGNTKWNKFFSDWFYRGLKNLTVTPKDGIDQHKALLHLKCICGSFEPKHEHKEAAVAFLASQWFEDVSYTL